VISYTSASKVVINSREYSRSTFRAERSTE